jgi:hypothetical protein
VAPGEDPSNPMLMALMFMYRIGQKGAHWKLYHPFKLEGLESKEGDYLTDRLTDEALKWIEQNKEEPFFLYFSHYAVHDPIDGRPDLVNKYQEKLSKMMTQEGPPFLLEGNPDSKNPITIEEARKMLNDEA